MVLGVSYYKMVENPLIYFNQEHLLLRKMVREFANQELKPIALEIDKNSIFPKDSIRKISDLIHISHKDYIKEKRKAKEKL